MTCARCGRENAPDARFCSACGAETTRAPARDPRHYTPRHLTERILTSRSALEGERKQVTVLFADVKGSMELASETDPEEWHEILDGFFRLLADGVHRFEGTINQYTGDGIMALFGAPIAHEDHAQRACYAALHLRGELRRYADELRITRGLNFSVRMGLNSGEVVVGKIGDDLRMDYTAQGATVGLAQRMEQLAEAGRIYLTGETEKLVRGYVRTREVGPATVKGVAEPVPIFELEDVGRFRTRLEVSGARGLTRFVGRAAELSALDAALERAIAGEGQIAGVIGEPGIGKSRLCLEFVERARAHGIPVFAAHCPAHGKALPYYPILQLFRATFGVDERDGPAEARRKIAGALLLLDEGFRESLPLLFDFLAVADPAMPLPPIAPEARHRRLLEISQRMIRARGRSETAVLFVDDLHWIDPESDTFLAAIADAVAGTRTMLLVNYRPEYVAPWAELPNHRALDLQPLGAAAVDALTGELLGREPALAGLRGRIAERSGGNPFFAEELVQSLAEAGTLSGAKGGYRLTASEGDVALPATVQSVLDARIDRAGERPKEVLQAAAVIGPEFLERVLARVAELPEDDLRAALDSLRRAEFIVERALYPDAEWAFKHPLTQEAAYRSQLSSRRARLHAAVARAITDLLPERANENAALVAHHWELAGEPFEAAKSHGRAAEWIGVRDSAAADRHWRRARELLEEVPETDEALRLRLVACERILGIGWRVRLSLDEVERAFADGSRIAARLGDRGAAARIAAAHAANRSYFGPDSAEILSRTREAMTYAEETDDRNLRISILQQFAWVELLRGDVAAGLDVTARGIALAAGDSNLGRNLFGYSPLSSLHCFRGFFLMLGGRVAEGGAELERGIALAREIGDEDSLQFPLGQMSAYAYFSGDAERALPRVLEALDITARIGHRWGLAMAYDCLGHTYLVSGDWRRAADALAEARRARGDVDDPYQTCWLSQGLAEAEIGLGNAAEAVLLAEGAAAIANRWRWPYPECAARLTLCRALRHAHGRAAAGEIDEELTRIETLARQGRMTAFLTFAAVERAELRGLLGDADGRRVGLEAARRDLVAMGASALAGRLRPA